MSALAIVTTNTDPIRPGLTYKVEFEDEHKLLEWLDFTLIQEEKRTLWGFPELTKDAKTSITILHEDGTIEHRLGRWTWHQVVTILGVADDIMRDVQRTGSGRIPKRVLVATTSKERREGKASVY